MQRATFIALAVSGVLRLAAQAADAPRSKAADVNDPIPWTAASTVGLTINLIDPVRIEWMMFHSEGFVSITIGEKHVSMAAPLWKWRIISGRLRILNDDGKTYEELTLLSRDAKKLVARRQNGKIATYEIQEPKSK